MTPKTLELLNPIMINFDTLKVGDTLYDATYNAGEVVRLDKSHSKSAIGILLESVKDKIYYTKDGYYNESDANPSLFLQCPFDYLAGLIQCKHNEKEIEYQEGMIRLLKNKQAMETKATPTIEKRLSYLEAQLLASIERENDLQHQITEIEKKLNNPCPPPTI